MSVLLRGPKKAVPVHILHDAIRFLDLRGYTPAAAEFSTVTAG